MGKKMKIIIAADSFKGSATSDEVSDSIEKGIRKFSEIETEIKKIPIADGGEGTVDSVVKATDGIFEYMEVKGPLGKVVKAKFGFIHNDTAILEMAEASGINLISEEEKDPFRTNTYGVGEILKYILDKGIRKIFIGIGGSATNDGGAGMLHSLGVRFYDSGNNEIGYCPEELKELSKVDITGLDKRIFESEIIVLSDVSNPLCGENGASYIYGPQKGASPEDIKVLDKILENYGNIVDRELKDSFMQKPGTGAAGGLGYALLSICRAEFRVGIDEIVKLIGLEEEIKNSDLIITGEGRIDNQSVNGKAPIGIAKIAKKYNLPVIAIVGSSALQLDDIYQNGIDLVLDVINEPMKLERAMSEVDKLLEFAGEKAIRAYFLGRKYGKNNKAV